MKFFIASIPAGVEAVKLSVSKLPFAASDCEVRLDELLRLRMVRRTDPAMRSGREILLRQLVGRLPAELRSGRLCTAGLLRPEQRMPAEARKNRRDRPEERAPGAAMARHADLASFSLRSLGLKNHATPTPTM